MLPTYPISDWDSFEELHIVVEQLELSQRLLRSRSDTKARAGVILIDHVADVAWVCCSVVVDMVCSPSV
jgi:hypothetical protein